jgi:transcriptional regulator GlxA family with amidase domain
MPKIGILATDKCMASSISGLLDIFSAANYCISKQYKGEKQDFFQFKIISEKGHSVIAYNGQSIHVHSNFDELEEMDMIIAAPIMPAVFTEKQTFEHLEKLEAYSKQILKYHKKGVAISSVCTGIYLLAKAGILNGKQATTHWKAVPVFQRLFPDIDITQIDVLIEDSSIIMAGGAASYLDLGIELVRRFSTNEISTRCKNLLVFNRHEDTQGLYEEFDGEITHSDDQIQKIQQWLLENYQSNFTLEKVSETFGMGSRNFQRRFKNATGCSPTQYIQKIRISAAKNLLIMTNDSLYKITDQIGYNDFSSFSRLFKKQCGMTMSEYRQQFSSKISNKYKMAS